MNNCPICEKNDWKKKYQINAWKILECTECKFAHIDPFPTLVNRNEFYTEEKVVERNQAKRQWIKWWLGYPKYLAKKISPRDKNLIFAQKVYTSLPKGSSVLDIGCGDGSFLERIKQDYRCSGFEISEYLGNLAKRRGDMDIFIGNFLNQSQVKIYDAVMLISLIEHLPDPLLALKKCHELLNSRGLLLLKTVNYRCWNRKIMRKKWNGFRPPDHMIYFSPENLKRLLQKVGFRDIHISSFAFNDNMYCEAFKT